jgi:hypothetical protein
MCQNEHRACVHCSSGVNGVPSKLEFSRLPLLGLPYDLRGHNGARQFTHWRNVASGEIPQVLLEPYHSFRVVTDHFVYQVGEELENADSGASRNLA